MVLVAGMQLVSRGLAIEFVSLIEMCKRSACVKDLKVYNKEIQILLILFF